MLYKILIADQQRIFAFFFILHIFLLVHCLSPKQLSAQTYSITLQDIDTRETLSFRKLTFLPTGRFLGTDKDGKVLMDKNLIDGNKMVLISGFAIRDTLIALPDLLAANIIPIPVQEQLLAPVEIFGSQLRSLMIGNRQPVKEQKKAVKLVSDSSLLDIKYGALIELPRNKERYISKLSFHVGDNRNGSVEEVVNIRIMGNELNPRHQPFKIYDIREYRDLAPFALQDTITKSGWHEVILDSPILIPKNLKKIMIVLDLMNESSYFTVSSQNYRKSKIETAYFSPPYKLWIFEDSKHNEFSAFELELLVD